MELPASTSADPWSFLRARLRGAVAPTTFDVWLSPLSLRSWDGAVLELEAPAAIAAWVGRRYRKLLTSLAREVLSPSVEVRLVASPASHASPGASASSHAGARAPADARARPAPLNATGASEESGSRDLKLNPRYSFDQFIIGEGNRLAHAAALSVAELPGQAYNPLFLYAPPGLGKTHLLHAIGNYVTSFGGGSKVRYATVEAFTNHFLRALSSRSTEEFKNRYRSVDVLLIDDVQFLASKAKTEEEFFHTFNAVYENGRQLVITCDRVPGELKGIEQRLRERFEAGLVAEIKPPDHETRVAILRKRAALDGIEIPEREVFHLIAGRVTDNIRTLEGALIRIVAYHSLTGRRIDLELATTVLDSMYPTTETVPALTPESIREAVARHFSITTQEMLSPARTARIAWPRQVAVYLTRELTGLSLPAIGSSFGRNHATVIHACRRVEERIGQDASEQDAVNSLRASLRHQQADRHD